MGNLCENCDTPVEGQYCPRCGQAIAGLDIPVGDFARDFASEAIGLDSRVRLTLAPLFINPGRVPHAFVMGQRARFVPPIRLYLLASFVMFLVLSFRPVEVNEVGSITALADSVSVELSATPAAQNEDGLGNRDQGGFGDRLERRFVAGFESITTDVDGFSKLFMSRMAQSMFFLLPAFALLLKLAYRRRFYVHHIVFALYEHSVVFVLVTVVALPGVLGFPGVSELLDVLLLAVPIHLVIAMQRFYGESWPRTTAKGFAVLTAYTMIGTTTMMVLFLVSILTI